MSLLMWLKLQKKFAVVWIVTSSKALVETQNLHRRIIQTMMTVRKSTTSTAQFSTNCKVLEGRKLKLTQGSTWWSLSARVILVQSVDRIIELISLQTQDLILTTLTQDLQSNQKRNQLICSSETTTHSRRLMLAECKILWIFLVSQHQHHKSTLLNP
jgi:hypothetical protein